MKSEKEKMELMEKNRILKEQSLREKKALQIKASDIYKTIKDINSNLSDTPAALTDADWKELEKTVNAIYENFEMKLHDIAGEISSHEYRVCLLIKIGIRPANIAYLTNRSKEAINSTRKRLYEKTFNKKGRPADWDDAIRSL